MYDKNIGNQRRSGNRPTDNASLISEQIDHSSAQKKQNRCASAANGTEPYFSVKKLRRNKILMIEYKSKT